LGIAKGTGRYALVRGDLRALPFPEASFDVASCIQVLEHFEPPEARRLAAALGRLLKPGGLLLLSVPIFPASVVLLKRGVDAVLRRLGRGPLLGAAHLSHFSLRTALGLVPAGFEVVDVRGVRMFSLPGKALEDSAWYYRLHAWLGRRAPAWAIEVNVAARKATQAAGAPA
jgi:SAM-dependent methyltransferase